MRHFLLASHRRLLTVLALTAASLLSALSASARPVPGGGTPATTGVEPASTVETASAGVAYPMVLSLVLAVLSVGAIAYFVGMARQRRMAAHSA